MTSRSEAAYYQPPASALQHTQPSRGSYFEDARTEPRSDAPYPTYEEKAGGEQLLNLSHHSRADEATLSKGNWQASPP